MKKVCKELIDYFELKEGWDKEEILDEYCESILKKHDCLDINDQTLDPEEVALNWGDDLNLPLTLRDFANELFDEIIQGVCNVIATA